jgi:hypothetical protein
MTRNASMSDFLKNFLLKDPHLSSVGQRYIALAAFGKHPGWDDHVEDLGLETQSLNLAKMVLYVNGIGGQIDSGAWDKLDDAQQLPDFCHVFLWQRSGQILVGRLWSSSDGKGRKRYPMVVCAHFIGVTLGWALKCALPVLAELERGCIQATTADEVRALLQRHRSALRDAVETTDGRGEYAPVTPEALHTILHRVDVEKSDAFFRVAYQVNSQFGTFAAGKYNPRASHPQQVRVPIAGRNVEEALLFWTRFFATQVDTAAPLLMTVPLEGNWVDVTAGEPGDHEFFCLRASPKSVPLVSEVPFTLDNAFRAKATDFFDHFQRGELQTGNLNPPEAVSVAPHTAKPAWIKWLGVSTGVVVIVLGTVMVMRTPSDISRTKTATVATASASLASNNTAATPTNSKAPGWRNTSAHNQAATSNPAPVNEQIASRLREQEADQNYQAAMATARAAVATKKFAKAIEKAGEALKFKIGDKDAAELIAHAKEQSDLLAREQASAQSYQTAMAEATSALNASNYDTAAARAHDALKIRGTDPEASQILLHAQAGVAAVAALSEATNLWNAAKEASGKKQYSDALSGFERALRECTNASKILPEAAVGFKTELEKGRQGVMNTIMEGDYRSATNSFDRADYEVAVVVCKQHVGAAAFSALLKAIESEQVALRAVSDRFVQGDYTIIDEISAQPYAKKQPFAVLLASATTEGQKLKELKNALASNWQSVLSQLGDPALAAFASKPPFQQLLQQAIKQQEAAKRASPERLAQLDADFQFLLVKYGVVLPTHPYITDKTAKGSDQWSTILEPEKKRDQKALADLETQYGDSIKENLRDKYMAELRRIIDIHN